MCRMYQIYEYRNINQILRKETLQLYQDVVTVMFFCPAGSVDEPEQVSPVGVGR